MESQTLQSPPALKLDTRSAAAAGFCVAALFVDGLGWLLAVVGIVLLRRSVFPTRIKLILAALALAPKILFLAVRPLGAPQQLSFPIEPVTLATSSSLWVWSILIAGLGAYLLFVPLKPKSPQPMPGEPTASGTPWPKLIGLPLIGVAAFMLSGWIDDFQRIDDAGQGRWALHHIVRGTAAVFTRADVASIEAIDERRRGSSSYSVAVRLKDGRKFSATTRAYETFEELRKFAVTADLPPGTVRIHRRLIGDWTNGAAGFHLKDCLGAWEYADQRQNERSTIEFWLQDGRLAGKETMVDARGKHALALSKLKLSDTGDLEFQEGSYAEAQRNQSTFSFSYRSGQGDGGRFTNDGLQIGTRKYRKL